MQFGEMLAEVNGLREKGFRRWLFADGMAFLDAGQWWGQRGKRSTPHEGVDFLFYETGAGDQVKLAPGARVPSALDGKVVAVHGDFLGQTVWVNHGIRSVADRALYTAYGHLSAELSVAVGTDVRAGQILGSIVDPTRSGKTIASHLHFSVVLLTSVIEPCGLDWSLAHKPDLAEFVDPLLLHELA